jgi:uncharacterized membrane protein YraQ (UPF0718 family)
VKTNELLLERRLPSKRRGSSPSRNVLLLMVTLAGWWLLYGQLQPLSSWVTYGLLRQRGDTRFGSAVEFFIFEAPKVLMLLTLVVFGVGMLRSFVTPERTRKVLAGKRESLGNVLASVLGVFTPFCSCSAVPLFIGFVAGGVPLGVTFSFLIAAPMVNEVALVLLFGLFGWRVAALYLSTGILIAIVAGWTIGRLHMEKYVEEWAFKAQVGSDSILDEGLSWDDRMSRGLQAVREIVSKVWVYILVGIAVGAGIHGYVPADFMASFMGKGAWWSVPLAVLLGIPMYANAAGIIPVVHALLEKGAALGTVLAFMMSVIALSLPEMIILRKVLKLRLILTFVAVVGFGILMVGYLFNLLL